MTRARAQLFGRANGDVVEARRRGLLLHLRHLGIGERASRGQALRGRLLRLLLHGKACITHIAGKSNPDFPLAKSHVVDPAGILRLLALSLALGAGFPCLADQSGLHLHADDVGRLGLVTHQLVASDSFSIASPLPS
jgi:hypothetical protein